MDKNQKLILIALIGGGLFVGCLVIILAVVFLLPTIRNRNLAQAVLPATPVVTIPPVIATTPPLVSQPTQTEALPPSTPTNQPPPTTEALPAVTYEGVSFSIPPGVAQSVTPGSIPAAPGDPANSFPGDVYPAYLEFAFNDYALTGTFHKPKLMVYPAKEYAAMDPNAAQIIVKLGQVLQEKPTEVKNLPFLPLWNAAQFMQANIRYLDFQNGSGVRFLTQYGQAAWPINNKDMFYTFQGLTSDGNWYVAAIFPASHPSLPYDDQTVPGGDPAAFAENFTNYLAQVEPQLSALPDDSFTPSLAALDAMVQSLQVK
jgi:hypothetical protein